MGFCCTKPRLRPFSAARMRCTQRVPIPYLHSIERLELYLSVLRYHISLTLLSGFFLPDGVPMSIILCIHYNRLMSCLISFVWASVRQNLHIFLPIKMLSIMVLRTLHEHTKPLSIWYMDCTSCVLVLLNAKIVLEFKTQPVRVAERSQTPGW